MADTTVTKTSTATKSMSSTPDMTAAATQATALTPTAPKLRVVQTATPISPAPAVVSHPVAVPGTPAAPKEWRGYRAVERARHQALLRDALLGLVLLVLREIVLVLTRELVAIGLGLVSLKEAPTVVGIVVPEDHAGSGLVLVQFEGWELCQVFRGCVDQDLRKARIFELCFRVTNARFIVGRSRTRPDRAEQQSEQPDQRAMGPNFHPDLI